MKKSSWLLVVVVVVACALLDATKPTYDVELPFTKFEIILIAIGCVASIIIILWLALSIIIWFDERRNK